MYYHHTKSGQAKGAAMNLPKKKVYKNGAILIYKKHKRKCTSVTAGFTFGKNRANYPEPIAHFCEHMLFKETENRDATQLKEDILNTFSLQNAYTRNSSVRIEFLRSNRALEPCFKLSSDILLNTRFNLDKVIAEKGVIKQELVARLNNPEVMSQLAFWRGINSKSYSNFNILGSEEEIEAVTPQMLQKFRDEVFISQNFVMTIEGGISFVKAKHLAKKHFINKLKSNPNYPVDKSISIPKDQEGNLSFEKFPLNKAICRIGIFIDQELEGAKTQNVLDLLKKISNDIGGKLLWKLRDNGLVYIGELYNSIEPNEYLTIIKFECSVENVNKVIDQIGLFFEELRTTKIEKFLIEKKKENKKLSLDEQLTSIFPSGLFISYSIFKDQILSRKYYKENKNAYEKITAEDIQELCQKILSKPENLYVSILTNASPDKFYTYDEIQKKLCLPQYKKKQTEEKEI